MKLYYAKSGHIIGFSSDKTKLPGEFVRIDDKDIHSDLRKSVLSGKYTIVDKKLKKGNKPSDVSKHLALLTEGVDETLKIGAGRGGRMKKSVTKVIEKKVGRKK